MGFMLAIVTSLPTWAVWTLAFGSPTLTAVIALLGHYFGHRAARDLEARSKREEVMRNLRWAAELAVSNDAAKARLGIQELEALRDSKMLTPIEQAFIYAALDVTIEVPRQAIAQSTKDVEVVLKASANVAGETLVSSKEGEQGEETDI
jgi:hypothetical protein